MMDYPITLFVYALPDKASLCVFRHLIFYIYAIAAEYTKTKIDHSICVCVCLCVHCILKVREMMWSHEFTKVRFQLTCKKNVGAGWRVVASRVLLLSYLRGCYTAR